MTQEEINYIIGHPIAEKVLGESTYLSDIIKSHWLTNDIAHIGFRYNQNKVVRVQLYLFDKWDLSHDDYSLIGPMLDDICNNKYKISMQLYEQLEAFPTIDKVKLLKSQLQFMQRDDLCMKLKSLTRYCPLFKGGKMECSSFEREDSDIIDFLVKNDVVKKRKRKDKTFLYLKEEEIIAYR